MPLPVTADHTFEVPSVSQPCLSGDGSTLAFVETTVDRKKMERKARIMVSRRPFDECSALTEGPGDTAPVVENERVFFLREDNGSKQVWTIPLNGGEARRITDIAGGVEGFALSPDGGSIAAVSTVDPDAEECEEPTLPRVRVVRRVRYRHDARGFTGDAFRHLFLVDVESGSARRITDGEGDELVARGGRLTAGRSPSSPTASRGATSPPTRRSRS